MVNEKAVSTVVAEPAPLKLSEAAIETIEHNIALAEKLIVEVLEPGVDYGTIPGVAGMSLWDPGSGKIFAAFNCYPAHQVIYHQEDDSLISWTIEARIIDRKNQDVVATGVGAASTKEPKYKYRWVPNPQHYGFSPEEIKTFRFRDGKYRIPNPEYGELVNTLLQMAAKRAEGDAAKSLPGVGSALRKLFEGKVDRSKQPARKEPDWPGFWGKVGQRGLSEEQVHNLLGVTSVNDWIAEGFSLDQAIATIDDRLRKQRESAGAAPEQGKLVDLTADDLPDFPTLLRIAFRRWNLQPPDVWKALGYARASEVPATLSAWDAYLTLKAIHEPEEKAVEEPPPDQPY